MGNLELLKVILRILGLKMSFGIVNQVVIILQLVLWEFILGFFFLKISDNIFFDNEIVMFLELYAFFIYLRITF